jgi:hypothetical protein
LAASYESLALDSLVATLPENALIQQKIPESIRVGTTCNLIWHEPTERPTVILITNEDSKGEVRVIFHPEILISSTLLAMAGEKYKMKIMGEIRYKTRGPMKPRVKRINNLLAAAREGVQAHKVCKEALNGLSIEKISMSQMSSQLQVLLAT